MKWTTRKSGLVEVSGSLPYLPSAGEAILRKQVMPWAELARPLAEQHAVPLAWVLGVIYAESGGRADVVSSDGGYGLMQLTHPSVFKGYPKSATLERPELNLSLGIQLMGSLRRRVGYDLPRLASGYNAGLGLGGTPHVSTSSPWGMRETKGHIDRVVRASNSAHRLMETEPQGEELLRRKVVQAAAGEIGSGDPRAYWEDSGFTYNTDLKKRAWCGVFALWALHQAGLALGVRWRVGAGFLSLLPRTKAPRPGDIAYDDQPWQHHSVVESLEQGVLTTIDGNQPDVRRKTRKLPEDLVFFSIDPFVAPESDLGGRPTLRRNMEGEAVKTLQRAIGAKPDGVFGPMTESALRSWQQAHGLAADGICGPKTWGAIDNA